MSYTAAKLLLHSYVEQTKSHAFTFEIVFPRIILAEFNTHRKFSKNTASSRAIPIKKMINYVKTNTFIPEYWGANQSGMVAEQQISESKASWAKIVWNTSCWTMCKAAETLSFLGVHKQITNRLLEPFMYVRMVFTTSDLGNFINLRCDEAAQPEIRELANCIIQATCDNKNFQKLKPGEWHIPYIAEDEDDLPLTDKLTLSVARCASTSYKTVEGNSIDLERANKILDKLVGSPMHASPFEHQLLADELIDIDVREHGKRKFETRQVWKKPSLHGNTVGWIQNRHRYPCNSSCNDKPHFLDFK